MTKIIVNTGEHSLDHILKEIYSKGINTAHMSHLAYRLYKNEDIKEFMYNLREFMLSHESKYVYQHYWNIASHMNAGFEGRIN